MGVRNRRQLIAPKPILRQGIIMPVVILKSRKGLSTEQKRRIAKEFTETLVSTAGFKKELVTIFFEEKELEDIAKGGRLRCDE
jgi:4-oxalocrotonate tautomerase family enzyme